MRHKPGRPSVFAQIQTETRDYLRWREHVGLNIHVADRIALINCCSLFAQPVQNDTKLWPFKLGPV